MQDSQRPDKDTRCLYPISPLPPFKPLKIQRPAQGLAPANAAIGIYGINELVSPPNHQLVACSAGTSEGTAKALDRLRYKGGMTRKRSFDTPPSRSEARLKGDENNLGKEDEYYGDLDFEDEDFLEALESIDPSGKHCNSVPGSTRPVSCEIVEQYKASIEYEGRYSTQIENYKDNPIKRNTVKNETWTTNLDRSLEDWTDEGGDVFILTQDDDKTAFNNDSPETATASERVYFDKICPTRETSHPPSCSLSNILEAKQSQENVISERFSPPPDFALPFDDGSEDEFDSSLLCQEEEKTPEFHAIEPPASVTVPPLQTSALIPQVETPPLPPPQENDRYILCKMHPRLPIEKRIRRISPETESEVNTIQQLFPDFIKPRPCPAETKSWTELPELDRRKPFIRPPLPSLVKERSLIDGLTNKMLTRTCFRVGEALRVAGMETPGGVDVWVELFARVTFSERVGLKQNIQFADVYHDRPPFLSGAYTFFKACQLWDSESAALIGEQGKGKMVRVVGRVKKLVTAGVPSYFIQIMRISETNWEEFEAVRRIICGK